MLQFEKLKGNFMDTLWQITQDQFDPSQQHHMETVFTIGNGYACTRGALKKAIPKTAGQPSFTGCSTTLQLW